MVKMKSADEYAKKYVSVTPSRQTQYQAGVTSPLNDWATNTKAAVDNYTQGVQASIANNSFAKGVAKTTTADWQDKTLKLGVSRWGPGVTAAQDSYASGIAMVVSTLSSLTLSPNYPKGDPRNLQRVTEVTTALHAAKINK